MKWLQPLIELLRDLFAWIRERSATSKAEKEKADEIERQKIEAWRVAIRERDRAAALRALGGRVRNATEPDQRDTGR